MKVDKHLFKEAFDILEDEKLSEALKKSPEFADALAADLTDAGLTLSHHGKKPKSRVNSYQCWIVKCFNVVGLQSFYLTREDAESWDISRKRTLAQLCKPAESNAPMELVESEKMIWAREAFSLASNLGHNERSLKMILKLRGAKLGQELGIAE